jgi:uncharacterized protein YqeY
MRLQEQLKKDMIQAMKVKDVDKRDGLRVVLGEFARLVQKEITDEEVIQILKKLQKNEKEVIARQNDQIESPFLKLIQSYLPKPVTAEEIRSWISENIDFDQFKNKMQAMGPIMKHFGSTVDGNQVKQILQSI